MALKPGRFESINVYWIIAFILLLVAPSQKSRAQSLSIVSHDSIVVGDATLSRAIYSHAAIKNVSTQDMNVKLKRIDGNYTALTDSNAICWGICYMPGVSVSNTSITIEAGDIDSLNFTGHVFPDRDGIPADGDITYVFFDENNPADSVAMTIHYQVVIIASIDNKINNTDIKIYPNPVIDFLKLDFSKTDFKNLTFSLYSSSGVLVLKEIITGMSKTNTINLERLPEGIYNYSITEDTRLVKTGKLILK